jgi:hypothetical protein
MSNSSVMKPRLIGGGSVVSRLLILLALLMVLLPSCLLAQEEGTGHLGVPTDWSHRHMVFSPPARPWRRSICPGTRVTSSSGCAAMSKGGTGDTATCIRTGA